MDPHSYQTFRIISAAVLAAATLAVVGVMLVKRPCVNKPSVKLGFNLSSFRLLVTLGVVFSTLALMATGFGSIICKGSAISGYSLMLHATAGGVFSACLAIWALLTAHSCSDSRSCAVKTASFWLMLAIAVPAIMSSTLGMFRIFGTAGQETLLNIHRWSTLLLSLCAIVYAYSAIFTKCQPDGGNKECKPQAMMAN